MAVRPGVVGSAAVSLFEGPDEGGIVVGLVGLSLESWVTGRIVAPLKSGELDSDLGDRGVKGLSPSELCVPGVAGEESLPLLESELTVFRSKLDTLELRVGMMGGNGGHFFQLACQKLEPGYQRPSLPRRTDGRTGDLAGWK